MGARFLLGCCDCGRGARALRGEAAQCRRAAKPHGKLFGSAEKLARPSSECGCGVTVNGGKKRCVKAATPDGVKGAPSPSDGGRSKIPRNRESLGEKVCPPSAEARSARPRIVGHRGF